MVAGLRIKPLSKLEALHSRGTAALSSGRYSEAVYSRRYLLVLYQDHHVHYSVAVAYAQFGDKAKARLWLARAIAIGFACNPWLLRDHFAHCALACRYYLAGDCY